MQKELEGRYKGQNIQFFGVSTGDPEWYLTEFKKETGATFPWLLMDVRLPNPYYRELFDTYELAEEFPTLILLDKNGIIRFRDYGGGTADKDLEYRDGFDLIGELIEEAMPPIGVNAGERAANFSLQDLDGNDVSLSDCAGTVTVLTFWDWGCVECREWSLPQLQLAQEQFGEDLMILAVNITPEPNIERLKSYKEDKGLTYPILLRGMQVAFDYNVFTIPIIFIIDQRGVIQVREHEAWKDDFLDVITDLVSPDD